MNFLLIFLNINRGFATIILNNFCLNHGPRKIFPKAGILALADIIRNDAEDDEMRAKQTLLIHATKGDLDMMSAADLFMNINRMAVVSNEDAQMAIWKTAGLKVISHEGVSSKEMSTSYPTFENSINTSISLFVFFNSFGNLLTD